MIKLKANRKSSWKRIYPTLDFELSIRYIVKNYLSDIIDSFLGDNQQI